jgi:pimeloyl-ACP methyl ester carboxylesterase
MNISIQKGTVSASLRLLRIALLISAFFFSWVVNAQFQGTWYTSFATAGNAARIKMRVIQGGPEVFLEFLDLPEQKEKEMTLVQIKDSTLSFRWANLGINFTGKYHVQDSTIVGSMDQGGLKWDVVFHRAIQDPIEIRRPQEPKPPFDYFKEDRVIVNGEISLGATLVLPKDFEKQSNLKIVILASGSGPQNRNCEIMGHQSFWVIADHFAKNGIGCLRFDDRGVGESKGKFQEATLMDFASDVNSCVEHLSKGPFLKKAVIGIAGHSEGGMHALIAASKNKNVDFIIELASVGTSGRDVLVDQQYYIPKQSGGTEEHANWNKSLYAGLCDLMLIKNKEQRAIEISMFLDSMYNIASDDYKASTTIFNFKIGMNMFINNPWGEQFIKFKAEDCLKKIKVPILAINGGADIQVPPIENSVGFQKGFSKKTAADPRTKAIVVESLNHLFQRCEKCTVIEYGDLEETFNVEVLNIMTDWVKLF